MYYTVNNNKVKKYIHSMVKSILVDELRMYNFKTFTCSNGIVR